MKIDDERLAIILAEQNYLSAEEIKKARAAAVKSEETLTEYLSGQNLLTNDLVGQAIAESFRVPYSDLNSHLPPKDQALKIPEPLAREFRCVLFSHDEAHKIAVVTTDNPEQGGLRDGLEKLFPGEALTITYSLPEDIDTVFVYYRKPLEIRFLKIIEQGEHVASEILEETFKDAFALHASDIHFEPQVQRVVVRFRIDGVLHETASISKEQYENIVNRVKVQSHLRIDEHYAAQDGSMRFKHSGGFIDLRTSIVPTIEGEKIALRILAAYVQGLHLGNLGLSSRHQEMLQAAARKPFGMILVTGPTGSGKTTTLYAVLKQLHRPEVNITTIEDPVEYKITGINQIQTNTETNLTFATGLRSIVRQDPDIILVGEIRDTETAEIAVNAALTGHLLLSTFHANDAATTIPRLLDMKVEPFLLASTLELIIAQRLVRKICAACRQSVSMNQENITKMFPQAPSFFPEQSTMLYTGKGCGICGQTGYYGRTAIFECIRISPELQDLIVKRPSTREIWSLAKSQGALSLFEDGIEKVKSGMTTLEELLRVAPLSHD